MTTTESPATTTTTVKEQEKKQTTLLLNLPNELLLYLFRNFLDLADIWCLFQTSQELRFFASTVIGTTWKIEVRAAVATTKSSESTSKGEDDSGGATGTGGGGDHMMIKLQCRSALIALQQLSNQLSFHQQDQLPIIRKSFLIEPALVSNTSTAIVHFLTVGSNILGGNSSASTSGSSSSDGASQEEEEEQFVVNFEEEEEDDDASTTTTTTTRQCDSHAASITDKSTTTSTPAKTTNKKLKAFQELIKQESRLHTKIIQGIASYKHKFVLIEDIDIRNRIRTAVDVVFHHAVFVSAISRTNAIQNRALAAVLVRLLTKLDIAFPSYCREITYTLADNIKAFLEYTGYKILAAENKKEQLKVTLASISACFDLMGAAFVGKILSDSHVDCAVQRACELLSSSTSNNNSKTLITFKRILLADLLDHWLTIKREIGSGELCRYIRLEIEKCGPPTSSSSS